jgi:hypothetical protein
MPDIAHERRALSFRVEAVGRELARYGLVVVVGCIGLMKFTAYEAEGISRYVGNSPLMSWVYGFMSHRGFSAVLGVVEGAVARAMRVVAGAALQARAVHHTLHEGVAPHAILAGGPVVPQLGRLLTCFRLEALPELPQRACPRGPRRASAVDFSTQLPIIVLENGPERHVARGL